MNSFKNSNNLNELLKDSWFSFKQLNTSISDVEFLVYSFQFVLHYVLFIEILELNKGKLADASLVLANLDLLEYFDSNFCFNEFHLLSIDRTLKTLSISKKINDIQIKVKISTEFLIRFDKNLFRDRKITDSVINEMHLLSLTLTSYGEKKVKEFGIYYTPMNLAQILTRDSIDKFLEENEIAKIKILDTSCGTGNFLLSSFNVLNEYYLLKNKTTNEAPFELALKILKTHIHGIEVNEWSIVSCKLRFFLILIGVANKSNISNINYTSIFKNFQKKDFLTSPTLIKPTIILGNPPWGQIGKENNKKHLANLFSYQSGQRDLYRFFIELSLKLDPIILSIVTPDSWLEIPGAKSLKEEFLKYRNLESIYILPKTIFPVKTHFIAFLSLKNSKKEAIRQLNIKYLNNELEIKKNVSRTLLEEEMREKPLIQLIQLDEDLYNFNRILKDKKNFSKLGAIVDGTVGYQLYHNSIHTPKEINEKVFHSKVKYNDDWIPEIKGKNIKLFVIDYSDKNYVKKTATFFRIPQKTFLESDKLVLREIISKEGLIVARSTKEILFPKSVLSIILKEEFSEKRLLTVMAYLTSYICFFDLVVNGIKGDRDFFPRLSIATLKTLSFNAELFNTDIYLVVKKLLECSIDKKEKSSFNLLYAQLQAQIFYYYNVQVETVSSLMKYLKIPLVMQENILKEIKLIEITG